MASKYFDFRWKIGVMLVSEVGPIFDGGRTEYSFNIDFDHLSIPELVDIAKDFGVTKLGTTYIAPSKGGKLVKLEKDKDLLDLEVLLNDGDTIDIFICNDSNSEDVGHVGQHVNVEEGDVICQYNATQQSSTGSIRKRSVVDSQQESTSKRGEARASRRKYKSPRVVGHGVFVSKTSYSCVNQGLQSSRLATTPTMINSAEVTGDIGYKPSKSLKWKGKPAISQRQLQMKSTMIPKTNKGY
ncbi:hypothetical protein A4A49_53354 [Nicotiana attenuata]|uniref:Uncharacterized protein n=1 Tax=Nicotiana attenuata TaxID=49451 RepID=A0A1J6KV63_NICAT|nr:hypothetical protein A4A49_53354 [Nicotiana attenuata]